jgi:hypothetical protein
MLFSRRSFHVPTRLSPSSRAVLQFLCVGKQLQAELPSWTGSSGAGESSSPKGELPDLSQLCVSREPGPGSGVWQQESSLPRQLEWIISRCRISQGMYLTSLS